MDHFYMEPLLHSIELRPHNRVRKGWLICNGQLVNIQNNFIGYTESRQLYKNRQPFFVLNYMIAAVGTCLQRT